MCLLQEPYAYRGLVCGLPAGTAVYGSESGMTYICVFGIEYKCTLMEECIFRDDVYVWMKGAVGEMLIVSLYCDVGKMSLNVESI